MSKKTKIWLFSGLGALAVLAIVLAIWQPWKKRNQRSLKGRARLWIKMRQSRRKRALC